MAGDASGDPDDHRDDPRSERETEGGPGFGTAGDRDDDWDRVPITSDDGSAPEREATTDEEADRSEQYGPEPRSTPVLAGSPSIENAAFVVLGAIMMVLVILRLASILVG